MTYTGHNAWTPECDAALTRHWLNGLSTALIGLAMGITKNAVVGRVHRLGLPARRSPIVRSGESKPSKIRAAPRVTLSALPSAIVVSKDTSVGQAVCRVAPATLQQGHAGADDVICRAKPEANAVLLGGGPAVPPDPTSVHREPCRWPLWPDRERPPANPPFCGAARPHLGSPYCAEHADRAGALYKPRLKPTL